MVPACIRNAWVGSSSLSCGTIFSVTWSIAPTSGESQGTFSNPIATRKFGRLVGLSLVADPGASEGGLGSNGSICRRSPSASRSPCSRTSSGRSPIVPRDTPYAQARSPAVLPGRGSTHSGDDGT